VIELVMDDLRKKNVFWLRVDGSTRVELVISGRRTFSVRKKDRPAGLPGSNPCLRK
jgi:hypothetical protein